MSESCARTLCGWTGKLPGQCRGTADEILAGAARQGMDLRDLAALAAEIQSRACPDPGDDDPGKTFEDRAVRLETTFGGAGVLSGDLTPECTALIIISSLPPDRGLTCGSVSWTCSYGAIWPATRNKKRQRQGDLRR
jgi:hypothetical protein